MAAMACQLSVILLLFEIQFCATSASSLNMCVGVACFLSAHSLKTEFIIIRLHSFIRLVCHRIFFYCLEKSARLHICC